jgi:hypothetical protein
MLQETNITCPRCNLEFPLSETLARPLIAAERAKIQRASQELATALKQHEEDVSARQLALDDLKRQLDARHNEIDAAVEQKLRAERDVLAKAAEKKAADTYGVRLLAAEQELAEKQAKLADAENAELALRKERRTLEEEKQRLELEIERRLQAERLRIREATQKEEEETYLLKIAEKDKLISDMKKQVEELRRKSEQTSQQLQGEVQELELEAMLKSAFPGDLIEPVPKGRNGGDVIHKVIGPNGLQSGTILWESKRTKTWGGDWLSKHRDDQRLAGAHVGAIISTVLPKGVDTFDRVEGVWVGTMRCALPLAKALRMALIESATAKVAVQGRDGKMEKMFAYLTGPHFRGRVSAIVEAIVGLGDDLELEKRTLTKQWAKRQRRLELLMTGSAGLYGDFQGIVGRSLPELQGLSVPQLDDGSNVEPSEERGEDEGGDRG